MTRSLHLLIVALAFLSLLPAPAAAQLTMEPAAPRWGARITLVAEPNPAATEADRFDATDHLFATISTYRRGLAGAQRAWTAMTWDGHRFVAQLTVPNGCEAAFVGIATAERVFTHARQFFVCATPAGTLPPGAMIEGLVWGGRERSTWQADVAADLAALRSKDDSGWAYAVLWLLRRSTDTAAFTREVFLRDVERVDREETSRTAGLLGSLVYGYEGAGETEKAFAKLKELCERFPASRDMEQALQWAVALTDHPEFDEGLNALVAQAAVRAPENPAFRAWIARLVMPTSGVPLPTIRQITSRWMIDDPQAMQPHYRLAVALSNDSSAPQQAEAEAQVSTAIELSMRPHPFDFAEQRARRPAFELRSRLRTARGDLAGAVADLRMAQLVAPDQAAADDISAESDLWRRLGFNRKADGLAWDAYRLGALNAEAALKRAYVERTGAESGFNDYLIARLRASGATALKALRATPAFSATTLDGATVDSDTLQGRITVVDFWFTTCAPCRVERPKLNDIVAEFGDKVRFVGFALDSPAALRTYLESNPYHYEVVPRSQATADAFGIRSYPTHMIIDRSGKIVWLSGNDDDRIERLRATIFRVLASQPATQP